MNSLETSAGTIASAKPLSPNTAAIQSAVRKIAPLWPLKHFVAVNPFLGLADHSFADAMRTMHHVAGARMTLPRAFYRDALRTGRITEADLVAARHEMGAGLDIPTDAASIRRAAQQDPVRPHVWPTVSDVATQLTGHDWVTIATDRISAWAADYFDEGQAPVQSPWRDLTLYRAWKAEAQLDRTPEVLGIAGFRAQVKALPDHAADAIDHLVEILGVPESSRPAYFHRLLMTVSGWAGYTRYLAWEKELVQQSDDSPMQLLAVRLAWEVALLRGISRPQLAGLWQKSLLQYEAPDSIPATEDLAIDLVLQTAYEKAWQREFLAHFSGTQTPQKSAKRPALQAAFCIDVRSEVYRRHLENASPDVETIGFAGFFGFALRYLPFGQTRGGAQCPVLLAPSITICEAVRGVSPTTEAAILKEQTLRRRIARGWKAFKFAAVSCFGFVGPVGWVFLFKMISDTFGWTRAVPHPLAPGLSKRHRARLAPQLSPVEAGASLTGLTAEQRLAMAEGVLKAMSMTQQFARVIVLAGHGSTTVNNAHASGLDCGACGGHTGEANARVAVAVFNDPHVRQGLRERGIVIPDDTHFIAGLHDTTTDDMTLFDLDQVPTSHAQDLLQIQAWFRMAGAQTRVERSTKLFSTSSASVDQSVRARSRDWSQVRPEWGLAGCAAFIAAPRSRTSGIDLKGRAFLHNYDWQQDAGFGTLELILTAPMVVASWISLQYYGSTVDNAAFGSGNKVLHNVAGAVGVFEGNGGDLRTGLPLQSVHDGVSWVHEPMRLSVVIEAPQDAILDIVKRHPDVRRLLDNGWLSLFTLNASGAVTHRYSASLKWTAV